MPGDSTVEEVGLRKAEEFGKKIEALVIDLCSQQRFMGQLTYDWRALARSIRLSAVDHSRRYFEETEKELRRDCAGKNRRG
jgi:hypothetical protein